MKAVLWGFVIRGTLALLILLLAAGWLSLVLLQRLPQGPTLGPTPPPLTILAPTGIPPDPPVGLLEWAQIEGDEYRPLASGFLFSTPSGRVVAATTAHSVAIGNPEHLVERIAFGVAGQSGFIVEATRLHGSPGKPLFLFGDLTTDFVLLRVDSDVDLAYVLSPDPRGSAERGEAILLYSGQGNDAGGKRILRGIVFELRKTGVWVMMDESFDPNGMSGSPMISETTGRLVGMAIASSLSGGRLFIGMHPIASLVEKAEQASDFPLLVDFRR